MSIARFYNQAVMITRLQTISGNKKNMVATGTYEAHIQRIDEFSNSDSFSVYGATHKGWTDITNDIKNGDQLTDEQGIVYSVVEVIDEGRETAMNDHKELILKKYTS